MSDKKVKYQESEESPLQDVVPQDSPLQDGVPQDSPLQDVLPKESPLQDVVPQESPLQDVVPHESPMQDVVPHESPMQDVVPQESPLQDVVPQESPLANGEPHESPLANGEPHESLLQNVEFQELPIAEVGLRKSPLSQHYMEQLEQLKKRRVEEACRRLKLLEQKNESQKGTSSQANVLLDKIDKDTGIVSSYESSISSTSGASIEAKDEGVEDDGVKIMKAKYNDSEDNDDVVESMMVENESSEFSSSEKLSVADGVSSDDPMFAKVEELMLVPSLSDFSLSDDSSMKPVGSLKSVASSAHLSQAESNSVESETEESSESCHSLRKLENENPDDFNELVIQEPISTEVNEVSFDEHLRSDRSIDFTEFFSKGNTNVRDSSFVEDTLKILTTKRVVRDFIDMLISRVTSGPSADQLKRSQLDKNKLHRGLKESLAEHMEAAMINDVLNGLMVEYYKLNKNTRVFAELSDADRKSYYNRYRNGMACVAYGEERVAAAKAAANRLTVMAQLELNSAMLGTLGTEHHFEETVRRILLRDSEHELLKRLIARELRLMSQYRTEISYERYLMISLKHDLAKFQNEIDNLDSVGHSVSMHDFLSLQAKVIGFEMKIDDRNIELKKMRSQYHKELHLTQHNREKIQQLKDKLIVRKEQLAIKNEKRNSLKEKLYHSKIHRKGIQDRSRELAYQGGILSMPSLMYDYDRTLDYIRQKQERIAALKETVRSLTQRLDALYSNGSQINVNS